MAGSRGWQFVRCTAVFDKDGRFAPSFDPAVTTVFEADQVLVAIGQAADLAYAGPALRTERGMIVIDGMTGATSLEGVFAGGDVTGDVRRWCRPWPRDKGPRQPWTPT